MTVLNKVLNYFFFLRIKVKVNNLEGEKIVSGSFFANQGNLIHCY